MVDNLLPTLDGISNTIFSSIPDIIGKIIDVISFLLNLITYIPKFFVDLPNEITTMLLTALSIILIIFIFRFIK